ncbi:unnamed protein product [Rotaria sp. Silwood2]|nr:unnamed protein product [Rotaria sp. Silwood2]CAF4448330.1 unnamed protein product [Rotaria sp. Silwood2]
MITTNAYRLFINRLCQSCPLKNHCSLLNKFTEQQERISLESTSVNHSDIQTINNNLNVSSLQHCFLCLNILHRYTSEEFIQQIKQVAQSTTVDFQTFCCNLTLPMNLFIRHVNFKKIHFFIQNLSESRNEKPKL